MRLRFPALLLAAAIAGAACSSGAGGSWVRHAPNDPVVVTAAPNSVDLVHGSSATLTVTVAAMNPPGIASIRLGAFPAGVTAHPISLATGSSGTLVIQSDPTAAQVDWSTRQIVAIVGTNSSAAPIQFRLRGRPGELDETFAGGGLDVVDFGSNSGDRVTCVALLGDGRILAGADRGDTSGYSMRVRRFSVNGDPDFSYSGVFGSASFTEPSGLALELDGTAIATGSIDDGSGSRAVLAHFLSDGSIDGTFAGGAGVLRVDPWGAFGQTGAGYGNDVVVAADGSIFLAGWMHNPSIADYAFLAHFLADGTADPSFGTNGYLRWSWTGAYRLVLDHAGRVVVLGNHDSSGQFGVARFLPTGAPDASFGSGGVVAETAGIFGVSLAVRPDDGLIVGGGWGNQITTAAVVALTSSGQIDGSFGPASSPGVIALRGQANQVVEDLAIDALGRIVVVGAATNSSRQVFEARFSSSGVPDDVVNQGAAFRIYAHQVLGDLPYRMVLDHDGRALVVGQSIMNGVNGYNADALFLRIWE